jgi:hypothetical protein
VHWFVRLQFEVLAFEVQYLKILQNSLYALLLVQAKVVGACGFE